MAATAPCAEGAATSMSTRIATIRQSCLMRLDFFIFINYNSIRRLNQAWARKSIAPSPANI
jgi:hypothetical protein